VSYFAAALARSSEGWTAAELDLDGQEDVEAVSDLLRDVEPAAELSLLFVESDDEFLVVLRLDEGEDLRVFGSDVAFADSSKIGDVLLAELEPSEVPVSLDTLEVTGDADAENESAEPVGNPVGDADLLTDLGISARDLLALCSHEGMLPADVMTEICRKLGCADELMGIRRILHHGPSYLRQRAAAPERVDTRTDLRPVVDLLVEELRTDAAGGR
jgi:putative tRNA adenosine deaminase-associated protein